MSFNLVLNEFMMGAGFSLWGQHLGVIVTSYLQRHSITWPMPAVLECIFYSALQCTRVYASMCLMLWT